MPPVEGHCTIFGWNLLKNESKLSRTNHKDCLLIAYLTRGGVEVFKMRVVLHQWRGRRFKVECY